MAKHSVVVVCAAGLAAGAVFSGCVGTPGAIPAEQVRRMLVGEWVNAENSGVGFDARKIVFRDDLSAEEFTSVTGTKPAWMWEGTLSKSWVDAEAYIETWDPELPRRMMLSGQWSVYHRTYTVYGRR